MNPRAPTLLERLLEERKRDFRVAGATPSFIWIDVLPLVHGMTRLWKNKRLTRA